MKTRYFFLFVALFACLSCTEKQQPKPKNVLFIISDDLNLNLGAYDHYMVQSPNIDRLAAQGMVFDNAFCNFPLCGPSRASMMTGLYPDQSGHRRLRDLIRDHLPDVTTLSQAFMQQGYEAARVGKIYHYGNPKEIGTPGHDDSLSWNYRSYPAGRDKREEDKIFSLVPGRFGATLSWLAAEGTDEEQTDGMVATEASRLLKQYAENETPFFLAVGFYKPHTPFVAPEKYFEMYPKEPIRVPEVPENYLATLPVPAQKRLLHWKAQNNLSDSLARCAIQAYYATISFLDAQVGRVVEALRDNGLDKNTIIVFTSDHGYHMGEHGYFQKTTLFEHSGRIPLIIVDPENRAGRTVSLAEMIDLYPTLCKLANIPAPDYLAGKSLVPLLKDPSAIVRKSALTQLANGYTLRTADFRYSRWEQGGLDMTELYDRRTDPAEMNNLARLPEYQQKIAEMNGLLDQRLQRDTVPPPGLMVYKQVQ